MATPQHILVVDDEPGVRAALTGILRDEGYAVVTAATGEQALQLMGGGSFAAVLLDVWLPGIDGLAVLQRGLELHPEMQVVMISGHGTIETAVRATKLGAFDFVEKPLSLDKTLLVLRNALRQRQLEQRNRQLLEQLSRDTEIVGRSAAAERLRREVEVAARSRAPVLIRGEVGSGRETVARRIHAQGLQATGPFVQVPCATLDEQGAMDVLHGRPGQPGRIEFALSGTLFLDDAERLPSAVQLGLAQSLTQRRESADGPRLIAATGSHDATLEQPLRQSLDVIRIELAPLRERREDVELLAARFMAELAKEYGRQPKALTPACRDALRIHDWPGNVRQLRNLMERLLLTVEAATVQLEDLPEAMGGARIPDEDLYRPFASLAEGLAAFERYQIARVLAEEKGDPDATASRLGLTRSELLQRMGALRLKGPPS
jgi:two-component system nitrogen regulation response regulator NtrX